MPSRPWLLLGLVPGRAGLWLGAGWLRAGQKEELCCISELLSVEAQRNTRGLVQAESVTYLCCGLERRKEETCHSHGSCES